MRLRQTHTFSILEISKLAYEEINRLLKQAGWDHAIMQGDGKEVIDMNGVAITGQTPELESFNDYMIWRELKKEIPDIGRYVLIKVEINSTIEYFLAFYKGNNQFRIETNASLQDDGTTIRFTSAMSGHLVTHWAYVNEPK